MQTFKEIVMFILVAMLFGAIVTFPHAYSSIQMMEEQERAQAQNQIKATESTQIVNTNQKES